MTGVAAEVFSGPESAAGERLGKCGNMFGHAFGAGASPRGWCVANFHELLIQEFLPAGGEIRESYFSHSASTVITLCECPVEVVCEMKVPKKALSVLVIGDSLTGFHLHGAPWMDGVACCGVRGIFRRMSEQ